MQSSTDILIAHDLQHKDPIHPWASTVVVIADYLSGTLGVIFNEIVVVSMATVPAILTQKNAPESMHATVLPVWLNFTWNFHNLKKKKLPFR